MARVVVIGGTGHVGTYLVPALVERGDAVVNVSRTGAPRYASHAAWRDVEQVTLDRDAEERAGTFAPRVAALRPDVVVDMIAFELASTRALVDALRGRVAHFVHCSTIWVHGHHAAVPADEDAPLAPFGEYGIRKAEIDRWLLHEARDAGFPATIVRPGHIVGPGWAPINPQGHLNVEVFSRLARGDDLTLPNFGLETLHHVHAADVAQLVLRAIARPEAAIGEAFNAVSPQALTLRGFAEGMCEWFGVAPRLRFLPMDAWMTTLPPDDARVAWEHVARSSCMSPAKAARLLGHAPAYTSLGAVREAVTALIARGEVSARVATDA